MIIRKYRKLQKHPISSFNAQRRWGRDSLIRNIYLVYIKLLANSLNRLRSPFNKLI